MEPYRAPSPTDRIDRIAGRVLAALLALVTTYFAFQAFDMLGPLMGPSEAGASVSPRRAALRPALLMIFGFGWAYGVWVSFRYVWSHSRGTVYTRALRGGAVAFAAGSLVQGVFTILVAAGVEQGDLTTSVVLVPFFMVIAAACFVSARSLESRPARGGRAAGAGDQQERS